MAESPTSRAGLARRGRRAGSHVQAASAALLAALVLLGGLEIHPATESHEPLAGLAGHHDDVYFQGASHPVQPPHAETAKAAQRPLCALCLNRLQSMGARLAQAARLSSPLAGRPLTPAVAAAPVQRSLRPDGARAPPLA